MIARSYLQEPQMVPQVPAAHFAAPDLALQQQLAAQGRLPGGIPVASTRQLSPYGVVLAHQLRI